MRRSMMVLAASVAVVLVGVGCGGSSEGAGSRSASKPSTAQLPAAEIVFTRSVSNNGRSDLYVMAADGSHVRRLVQNASGAAASPDGRRIAFMRNKALWLMRRDGSGQKQLTNPCAGPRADGDSAPAWSPDGPTIYFSRSCSYTDGSIYAMRADGSGLRHLTRARSDASNAFHGVCQEQPAPSPDGHLIAYVEWGDCERGHDANIDAITTTGRRAPLEFASPGLECASPDWAPTGKQLAYDCFETVGLEFNTSEWGIFVSTVGGSSSQHLVRGGGWSPAWSPDGLTIAFDRDNGIWRVDSDGKGLRHIAGTGPNDGGPAWLPLVR